MMVTGACPTHKIKYNKEESKECPLCATGNKKQPRDFPKPHYGRRKAIFDFLPAGLVPKEEVTPIQLPDQDPNKNHCWKCGRAVESKHPGRGKGFECFYCQKERKRIYARKYKPLKTFKLI